MFKIITNFADDVSKLNKLLLGLILILLEYSFTYFLFNYFTNKEPITNFNTFIKKAFEYENLFDFVFISILFLIYILFQIIIPFVLKKIKTKKIKLTTEIDILKFINDFKLFNKTNIEEAKDFFNEHFSKEKLNNILININICLLLFFFLALLPFLPDKGFNSYLLSILMIIIAFYFVYSYNKYRFICQVYNKRYRIMQIIETTYKLKDTSFYKEKEKKLYNYVHYFLSINEIKIEMNQKLKECIINDVQMKKNKILKFYENSNEKKQVEDLIKQIEENNFDLNDVEFFDIFYNKIKKMK